METSWRRALAELSEAQEKLSEVSEQRDLLQAEISQLLQRASWKLTAPLRAVRAFFKGRRS